MKTTHIILSCIMLLSFPLQVIANDLDSTNYKLVGVSTTSGGGIGESARYNILSSIGDISISPRNYSTNYRINQDPSAMFTAAQPSIQCFETDTNGSTNCTSGPQELLDDGMVALCGSGGCYDRARFEIEPYVNPSDTLYMVQISTDDFGSDMKCVDGSTFSPKTITSCDINDFRTEEYWEDEIFNIRNLQSNTEYYIRVTALHGDFTQSDYSQIAEATTTLGAIEFDIDIATESGISTESTPPYSISFSGSEKLVQGAPAVTATSLIWLDIMSSSSGGLAVIQFGKYGGLYSPTTTETIESATENLDTTGAEGFGLQSYYLDYDNSPYLGELSTTSDYSGSGNYVGIVGTTGSKIYDGDGPINLGRAGIYLKARASTERASASDYGEEIYFILVPRY